MPAISLVIVTNGPALMAGSILDLKNRTGTIEPIIAAMLTANTIPVPTTKPSMGDD